MIFKYVTKKDASGNRYTLTADAEKKTYRKDYNLMFYDDFITVTKKDRNKIESQLIAAGYIEEY